jgi:histidinol dehydrogenase
MKIIRGYNDARKVLSREYLSAEEGDESLQSQVRQWVEDVRRRGDDAVREYTEKFDHIRLESFEVPSADIVAAYNLIDKELVKSLELAAERITSFHAQQKKILLGEKTDGSLGWVIRPLERIGVLAPGFQAPLPSSVLMTAIPARVAGVNEIILATPPKKDGKVSDITLAAAKIAGVDRVFSISGAQGVAALAYGTETVPRVDKIFGPGNKYVTMAKKILYGAVGIDGLYGPSEVLIIADESADPVYCAADMLGQAEHGSGASAILVTTSEELAEKVNDEIKSQLISLGRSEVIRESLDNRGLIAVVDTIENAIALGNSYAPEHLCLICRNAEDYIKEITNAGCLFIGEHAIEVLVDYIAGPSHVLPTEGTARFSATLNITDFVKIMTVVTTGEKEIRELGQAAATIARAEGLDAHARAVERRLERM